MPSKLSQNSSFCSAQIGYTLTSDLVQNLSCTIYHSLQKSQEMKFIMLNSQTVCQHEDHFTIKLSTFKIMF